MKFANNTNTNSVKMNGNSKIMVDSVPVLIRVAGVNESNPIVITGTVTNTGDVPLANVNAVVTVVLN